MKKWLIVGIIILAAGLVAQAQEGRHLRQGPGGNEFHGGMFAGGGEFGGMHRMGPRLLAMLDNDRVKTELGLSDDQTTRLRQIVVDTEKSAIKTRAEMAVRGIELRELLRADKPDRQVVLKKVDEISMLRQERMKQNVDALLSAKSVLTPEQQKKIRAFGERRHGGDGPRTRFFQQRVPPPHGGPDMMPHPPVAPEAPPQP